MMQATESRSTRDLFKDWRHGDASAGQAMAQRFADWYYAIATSRLGESGGRAACEAACGKFSQGIVGVTEVRNLVPWAHEQIADELVRAGSRARDGDEANAYTLHQSPKAILAQARVALPVEVALLEACYGGRVTTDDIDRMSEPLGGNPLGILRARYRVKAWLREQLGIPFEVTPSEPNLDRAPLPLYESGRMATPAEETSFEHWMISDLDLCRDIAEFAQFALALRGGLPLSAPAPTPAHRSATPTPAPVENRDAAPVAAAAAGGVALVGVAVAVVVAIVLVAVGVMVLSS
jgi:hypothetical protein